MKICFYDKAHLHICLISLTLVVSSLTEVHYFQIEPGGKGTYDNESMMLKMFFSCMDSSDEQSASDRLKKIIICSFISFVSLQLK